MYVFRTTYEDIRISEAISYYRGSYKVVCMMRGRYIPRVSCISGGYRHVSLASVANRIVDDVSRGTMADEGSFISRVGKCIEKKYYTVAGNETQYTAMRLENTSSWRF